MFYTIQSFLANSEASKAYPCLPKPIIPTVMRLEGAYFPKKVEGTIEGMAIEVVARPEFFRKFLRFIIL